MAEAVRELVLAMTGPTLPLAIAAGAGEDNKELGTDATEVAAAIVAVKGADGVIVLMDMGSAILSAETALDLLDESMRTDIRFCAAPFVEGAVAAGVTAHLGASLDEVCAEAQASLKQKEKALLSNVAGAPAPARQNSSEGNSSRRNQRSVRLVVRNPHGLHARPAAGLITETRPFAAEITVRNLANQRGPVSAKSLSSLALLEIVQGSEIEVTAFGPDADAALTKITGLVESGFGEGFSSALSEVKKQPKWAFAQPMEMSGPVPVSDGIAIGPIVYFRRGELLIPQDKAFNVEAEISRLRKAVAIAQEDLQGKQEDMGTKAGESRAGIYGAQVVALQDPELADRASAIMETEQVNAALAWSRAYRQVVSRYEELGDEYLRERAVDVDDVGRQVLRLLGVMEVDFPEIEAPSILITDNLTPFEVSKLSPSRILGVLLFDGAANGHSSILLRALDIPAIAQTRRTFADVKLDEKRAIAFDGATGKIWLEPDGNLVAKLRDKQGAQRKRLAEEKRAGARPAMTSDGCRIEILANIGGAPEVDAALEFGAEGIGLLRTEFLFLDRVAAPTEAEQFQSLRAIAEKMGQRPVIVRTLDAGGDKELPYLELPAEDNPFLGIRAIRLCFSHDELFTPQLRAILRAGVGHDVRIMFPMIANTCDLDRAKKALEQVHLELEQERIPHLWPIQTGIMIEIPSAALMAESLAEEADFFSIGTNDLTQYVFAADRGNPGLAGYQDALHPAVLKLIEQVVLGARQRKRHVAVCGEAASDELAAAIFVGLGVEHLSMNGAKIPRIKNSLGQKTLTELRELAAQALSSETSAAVRSLAPPQPST